MSNLCHVMLDIESLGTRPGCVVLSAAFVRFEDMALTSLNLSMEDQYELGLETGPSTLDWWRTQSQDTWRAATCDPFPLVSALNHFSTWLGWARAGREMWIWCHGAGFDAPLLQEVYQRAGIACPWSFRDVRDTRTLYDLAGVDSREYRVEPAHIAANDALGQARAAVEALRRIAELRGQQ